MVFLNDYLEFLSLYLPNEDTQRFEKSLFFWFDDSTRMPYNSNIMEYLDIV